MTLRSFFNNRTDEQRRHTELVRRRRIERTTLTRADSDLVLRFVHTDKHMRI